MEGTARALIEAINAGKAPVYAVDLPSGINGTSGAVLGVAVKATHTITFFRKKPGHLLLPGRLHCGTVTVADIGIPAAVLDKIAPKTFENVPALWRRHFPVPKHEGHKYDRGHAVVVSGPSWSTGAARLAARGALRAGAGLVTIASPRDALAVNAAASLAVMVRPVDGAAELAKFLSDRRLNALAIGPGARRRRSHLRARPCGAYWRARGGARCRCDHELCRRSAAPCQGAQGAVGAGHDLDAA